MWCAEPVFPPGIEREMKTPVFWINRHPYPDKVILNKEGIEKFNSHIRDDLKLTRDITAFPDTFSGQELRFTLEKTLSEFLASKSYFQFGFRVPRDSYLKIKNNLDLTAISDQVPVQFGVVVHNADQRFLPLRSGIYAEPGDVEFDPLQVSNLNIGLPVAVLHKSRDGKWYYAVAPASSGWVEARYVALASRQEMTDFMNFTPFAIVSSARASIFLGSFLSGYYDFGRMGTRLPLAGGIGQTNTKVLIPVRKKDGTLSQRIAYLKKEDVQEGYLPYTSAAIIRQAFLFLGAPYQWGGKYGRQDCSQFIEDVFASVGIVLPRNSIDQAQTGIPAGELDGATSKEKRLEVLSQEAVPGITLLYMKNHVMLFLGMVPDGPALAGASVSEACVIHDIWSVREISKERFIGRVVVSGLSLGENTPNGSYLNRLLAVRVLM